MSYLATVINVMIATPSDVATERQIVRDVLNEWNVVYSHDRRAVLLPIGWDTHSAPEMGDRPQGIINKRILEDADLLVAVFWTRLGSPTGRAASGTVEEIQEHVGAGKPAMIYFSSAPVRPESVEDAQYRALRDFRGKIEPLGLVESYESMTEFRAKFSRQLALTVIRQWNTTDTPGASDTAIGLVTEMQPPRRSRTPELSADAKTLLLEAAADQSGMVLVVETFGGLQISTNSKELVDEQSPRAEARWRAAVDELVRGGFLEDRVGKGEVFSVTHAGYAAAELFQQQ